MLSAALVLAVLVSLCLPPEWLLDVHKFNRPADTVLVVDRNGNPLKQVRPEGQDRRWVTVEEVSPHLRKAFLAAEDHRFETHAGVDWRAVARASLTNLLPWRRRSGASTITQQVVKLVYGRPAGLFSKGLEILRARALEKTLSKDEILEQYLNRVPFGDRIEGVARASEEYFGQSPSQVSLAEAALLAGIPQAPSVTEPRRHRERALRRRKQVLARMLAVGFVDQATYQAALAEVPRIREGAAHPEQAPRFVDQALAQWKKGKVDRKGIILPTALDLPLQNRVEELLGAAVARFASRHVTNGAALVVANETGEILAYVGAARRGIEAPAGSLDLLTRPRQPGSTLKPFVYELLFEQGGTAATILDDIALPRTGAGGRLFEGRDYDGLERGPVRAREALASSLNLAALDAAARVGQEAILKRLRSLGFGGLREAEHYGAAVVLGGLEVLPIDLAHAYVALARGGTAVPLSFAQRGPASGVEILNPAAAAIALDILSDPQARAQQFGRDLVDLAGVSRFGLKTGTSSGFRDAWAVAFSKDYTVVVWLGDPAGNPLRALSGFEGAAPAAAQILSASEARVRTHNRENPAPVRLVQADVCRLSGLLPGPRCRHSVREVFAPGTIPTQRCTQHDEQGRYVLPPRYRDWAQRNHSSEVSNRFALPTQQDSLLVVEPRDGARLLLDPSRGLTALRLRAKLGGSELLQAQWEVDGTKVEGDRWLAVPGQHKLVATYQGHSSPVALIEIALPH